MNNEPQYRKATVGERLSALVGMEVEGLSAIIASTAYPFERLASHTDTACQRFFREYCRYGSILYEGKIEVRKEQTK